MSSSRLWKAITAVIFSLTLCLSGCGDEHAQCGPSSCAGCCNPDGSCHSGMTSSTCGKGGVDCQDCGGDWCIDGECRRPGAQCSPAGATRCDGDLVSVCQDPGSGDLEWSAPIACDDDDPCTLQEHCQDDACVSDLALDCTDEDPCTDDACVAGQGCTNEPVQDGTPCIDPDLPCGGGECQSGACTPIAAPDDSSCDGIDSDCDGLTDEDCPTGPYRVRTISVSGAGVTADPNQTIYGVAGVPVITGTTGDGSYTIRSLPVPFQR